MYHPPIDFMSVVYTVDGTCKEYYTKVLLELVEDNEEMKKDYKKVLQLNYNDNFDNYPQHYGKMFLEWKFQGNYYNYYTVE